MRRDLVLKAVSTAGWLVKGDYRLGDQINRWVHHEGSKWFSVFSAEFLFGPTGLQETSATAHQSFSRSLSFQVVL